MKRFILIIMLLDVLPAFGQYGHCFCSKDTLMNDGVVSCDTTMLSNRSKLYWQYNCDSIWLTLENDVGEKYIIDRLPIELSSYTYRLGFYLIKEFDKTLLFQSGCAANGPCLYSLIDKDSGFVVAEFDQLICIDDMDGVYDYDFVVYLSESADSIIVYFIHSGQTLKVPFNGKLTEIIPQYQFYEMKLENTVLTLYYMSKRDRKRTWSIDLKDKVYRR